MRGLALARLAQSHALMFPRELVVRVRADVHLRVARGAQVRGVVEAVYRRLGGVTERAYDAHRDISRGRGGGSIRSRGSRGALFTAE